MSMIASVNALRCLVTLQTVTCQYRRLVILLIITVGG